MVYCVVPKNKTKKKRNWWNIAYYYEHTADDDYDKKYDCYWAWISKYRRFKSPECRIVLTKK